MNNWAGFPSGTKTVSGDDNMTVSRNKLSDISSVREALTGIESSKRSYYSLKELSKMWVCPVESLLDLGHQGKLRLSVMAAKWRVQAGCDSKTDPESNDDVSEHIVSGHVDLAIPTIQALISEGNTSIEDLWAEPGFYYKVIAEKGKQLPVANLDSVQIQRSNAIEYLTNRAAELAPQPSLEPMFANVNASSPYKARKTDQIAKLFRLDSDDKKNLETWRNLAHHAMRNGLAAARVAPASSKQGRTQTIYHPEEVGKWLVDQRNWDPEKVARILERIAHGSATS